MHIEVMLMDNVKKLGKAGEIVKVAPGYFRNYLAPKGLASVATEAAKRRLKKLEAERAARAAEEKKAALAVAKKLEG
ncbi:MAG: 50S ribosomal protein L9, partial [Kiritimatiellae bacterium]|nr:50S ribosomal protein L9 [Kiritimatiellia bacterium]